VVDVNSALLNIIINVSPALVTGPPEAAREIALIDGAMFDAVNASSGCPANWRFIAYHGGCVTGADPNAAALQAALTVMNSLYGPSSLYQQYKGVTGAAYYGSSSPYAGTLVGPTTTQMTEVARQISLINAELTALNPSSTSLSLGTNAGNAMLALAANDGGQAAADAASAAGRTSQEYALQVLQTECEGSGTGLPSNIGSACSAAGFAPESAAEAQSALFWNDPGGTQQPPGHWLQIADM
jgi:hypothetical protein